MYLNKFFFLGILILSGILTVTSQENNTVKVWRVNFLNPGIEHEFPVSENATLSIGAGIGYSISYPHSDIGVRSGFIISFNPFLDTQYKWFYNLDKRKDKKLRIDNNSGNFISARILTRSESLFGNSNGTDKLDFAIGPTWGIQRQYGKNFHFLVDLGPIYYFDIEGRKGFFPLMIQLNLGFNI